MRKLGEAFYGRVKHYDEAFEVLPDRAALEAIIGRTVLAGQADAAGPLAAYAISAMDQLDRLPLAAVLQGDAQWPTP